MPGTRSGHGRIAQLDRVPASRRAGRHDSRQRPGFLHVPAVKLRVRRRFPGAARIGCARTLDPAPRSNMRAIELSRRAPDAVAAGVFASVMSRSTKLVARPGESLAPGCDAGRSAGVIFREAQGSRKRRAFGFRPSFFCAAGSRSRSRGAGLWNMAASSGLGRRVASGVMRSTPNESG